MKAIENFFTNIFNIIINFFTGIWNLIINALNMIFPKDFSVMIAIVVLAIIVVGIFLGITKNKD